MTTGLRDGTPSEAGLSAGQLDHASDLAASWVKDGSHPALVVLVARRGVVALHEAFGRLGPEPDDPALTRDALFPLASLAKPINATALMTLVEEGRVGLTRRVNDYIPEFQGDAKDTVFVHHLLTHTSGLQSPFDPQELISEIATFLERPARDPALHPFADAFVQLACERPLGSAPGEQMFYDTLNYDLVGEIVRRVSGRSLRDFVHERIFDPLGMTDSYVTIPDEVADRAVRATPESPLGAAVWEIPMPHVATGGGAGFYSTARDMAVFGQAFLDRGRGAGAARILARSTMEEMITNQIPGVPGFLGDERHDEASWGYGWGIACAEKWAYFPTHPPGTFQHGGLSGVYLWCDSTNDIVGAYFSAATKEITPEQFLWHADLFANAVTAAIED